MAKAYEAFGPKDQALLRSLLENPKISGGYISRVLTEVTQTPIDHMAVDHFRRKLRLGKVTL